MKEFKEIVSVQVLTESIFEVSIVKRKNYIST
jgi:hypothetical protein